MTDKEKILELEATVAVQQELIKQLQQDLAEYRERNLDLEARLNFAAV